ncbi:transposase, IS481 family [Methylomarinovum tepidoasis]|uniref:Transposase, IS481 family n=1 Tax=Methylomarinovum tepidoasis TaxID=2840183 RepID=A0AAU9CKW1_9GAMM|nr:IS481 family transposase [Methylomarinovum sp. IN45]BCX88252.1 transposase, IS481 family [Methylomarinovum sp. IN45]
MVIRLHKKARTTPEIRREIQNSDLPATVLAKKYGVHRHTIRKWRQRDSVEDASHRPHRIHATLTPQQEAIVVCLRETLLLPLDDLLAVVHRFIYPEMSRSALDRLLRRHGVSNLKALIAAREGEDAPSKGKKKGFKDYEPGFVHIDIKYLPKMPDESRGRYLFVAIDRASRWVYLEIHPTKEAKVAAGFLNRLIAKAPFKITKVLTDNGKEFTDRFCATGEREPTGRHLFDQGCQRHGIEHRLIPPKRPQTNGMVERFNGRIAEILKTTRFQSSQDLERTLMQYASVYNHQIPQKALGHISPVQALKDWQKKRPELFKKRVHNLTGLDIYRADST